MGDGVYLARYQGSQVIKLTTKPSAILFITDISIFDNYIIIYHLTLASLKKLSEMIQHVFLTSHLSDFFSRPCHFEPCYLQIMLSISSNKVILSLAPEKKNLWAFQSLKKEEEF